MTRRRHLHPGRGPPSGGRPAWGSPSGTDRTPSTKAPRPWGRSAKPGISRRSPGHRGEDRRAL